MENKQPILDFTLINKKKRKQLFFKRPLGMPIPVGCVWRCICGIDQKFTESVDQYCQSCGSRLRLQENADADSKYFTAVLLFHFDINQSK